MEIVLLGAILLCRVVQSISGKSCSRLMPGEKTAILGYMSLRMGISSLGALVLLIATGDVLNGFSTLSWTGWCIAGATGISLTVSSLCSLQVLKGASIALGSLFSAAGLLIPTIAGVFLFGQAVGIGQWLGIAGLFVSAVLLASSSGRTNGKLSFHTVLLLLGSMLGNGSTMLLQTLFRMYVPEGNVSTYSFLQFAIPAMVLFVVCAADSAKGKKPLPHTERKLLGFTVAASVAVLLISQISTIASQTIPVAVLFPISDGGGTVISALVAAIMFKERITVKSGLGIAISVLSLVGIKLFSV